MATEASLKAQIGKLESLVEDLTKENQTLKTENKDLLARVAELEKKLNIQPTTVQTKSTPIVTTTKESPAKQEPTTKPKEEPVVKPVAKGWPNVKKKYDDSDSDSSEGEPAGKFVPENKKNQTQAVAADKFVPETRKKATTVTANPTTTASSTTKKFESNISSEKLLTPSFGGGVYIPPTDANQSANIKKDIAEENKGLDKALKGLGTGAQVKFVTKWIPSEDSKEDPSQGTKTTEDTTATKTTDSADKKRNTIAVSNPTQLQNDLSKAMASSVSLNLVWKSGGFAELSKNAESNQANVTDIKFDLNGAASTDYKNVLNALQKFKNLKELDIKGMALETKDTFSSLIECLQGWSKLETFKFQQLKGSAVDAGLATKLTDAIRAIKPLKELRINCRSLTPDVELQLKALEKVSSKFQIWAI